MQISKSMADMIAKALVDKKYKEIESLREEFKKYVYVQYLLQTPAAVKRTFKKFPEWFETKNYIVISTNNWSETYVQKPVICNKNGRAILHKDDAIRNKIDSYKLRIDKLTAEVKSFRREIEVALIQLRTTKRIAEQFPEAKKYLPKPNLLPMVNIDPIREKLKRIA